MQKVRWIAAIGAVLLSGGIVLRACHEGTAGDPVPATADGPRAGAGAPAAGPRPRAAPLGREGEDVAESASGTEERPRPGLPSEPARLEPREQVPAEVTVLDPARDLRAWAVVERAPRGLTSERGALPGRVQVHLSRPASDAIVFRIATEPDGALRLPRSGLVRVERDRDFGAVTLPGVAAGPAVVVLTPLSGARTDATIRVPIDVRAADEFPEPVVSVVVAPPDASTPGALLAGERSVRGLAGSAAATLRVMRSAFRGLARDPTEVSVAVDDPDGVVEPLPTFVTIAAGETEAPERVRVTLRSVAGRAVVRFRAGAQELAIPVESVVARWTAPAEVGVAAGGRASIPLDLAPPTRTAPDFRVECDSSVVRASIRPADRGPYVERFLLDVEGVVAGECIVRVVAPHRPVLDVRVRVGAGADDAR
jgi:hypothetical protein